MALSRFRDPKAADAVFAQLSGKGDSFQKAAMLQLLGDRLKKEWKSLTDDDRTKSVYSAAIADPDLRLTAIRTLPATLLYSPPETRRPTPLHDRIVGVVTDVKQDMAVREAAFAMLMAAHDAAAGKLFEAELKAALGRARPRRSRSSACRRSANEASNSPPTGITWSTSSVKRSIRLNCGGERSRLFALKPSTRRNSSESTRSKRLPADVLEELAVLPQQSRRRRRASRSGQDITDSEGRRSDNRTRETVTTKGDSEKVETSSSPKVRRRAASAIGCRVSVSGSVPISRPSARSIPRPNSITTSRNRAAPSPSGIRTGAYN